VAWQAKHGGEREVGLLKVYRLRGVVLKELADKPDLWIGMKMYWEMFWLLSRCRTSNGFGGANPLAISEMIPIIQIRGFTQRDDIDRALRLLMAADSAYLAEFNKAKPTKPRKK